MHSAATDPPQTPPPAERPDAEGGLAVKTRTKPVPPARYKVLLLNDDFTPMDFVVQVLERFFAKAHEDALEIMLSVHRLGVGLCGVYSLEVAEAKVAQVLTFAREHQHPLQCTLERD